MPKRQGCYNSAMSLPNADIRSVADLFLSTIEPLIARIEEEDAEQEDQQHVQLLMDAFYQLVDVCQRCEHDPAPEDGQAAIDVTELGEYGMNLLMRFAYLSSRHGLEQTSRRIERLSFAFALWIVRHGGEVKVLEPVVNGIALLANELTEHADLRTLYQQVGEIKSQIVMEIQQDLEQADPQRPWRVLLLNHAIIATRTHQPRLMREAFATLVERLPTDAPEFFREGMVQMDALDYPDHVRVVVEEFHRLVNARKLLH